MPIYNKISKKGYKNITFGELLEEQIKIKPLTKQQIIISVDRLTRFKPTEDKYLRVFKDVVTSNLIYPKYNKNQLENMDYGLLKNLAENIINYSLAMIYKSAANAELVVNKKLSEYEKSVFKFDKNVEKLLDNKIDYLSVIGLLDCENLPLNLKWLKTLAEGENQQLQRENLGLKFPIEKIVLVEGITEEILLPKFAKVLGYDFDKLGVNLISAGGKKQVVKLFYQYAEILKLPIFVLLDSDAAANYEEIKHKLRNNDMVHVLESGEFEDVLPLTLIKRSMNQQFRNFSSIVIDDLRKNLPMTQLLEELFKENGMEFKKAEFAALVAENISSQNDVSQEIETVVRQIIDTGYNLV